MKKNKTVLLICIIIFCFIFEQICIYNDVFLWFFCITKGNRFTFITSVTALFFHSDYSHILNNIVVLFMTGYYLEVYENRKDIFKIFLLGAIANLLYACYFMGTPGGLLGASTGIYVLKGYALVVTRFWLIRFYIIWSIISNFINVVALPNDNIAYEAHVLGAVVGILYGYYEYLNNKEISYENDIKGE
jgi:membrane associated rhomboid family serine protease